MVDERTSNYPNATKKRKDPAHNGLQAFTDRNEAMRGAEGSNKVPRSIKERTKGWHDKRMIKKKYNIGDKMLMDSSSKESFKEEEKTTISHRPFITWCHHAPIMKVTS